jgi:hypothetical protein
MNGKIDQASRPASASRRTLLLSLATQAASSFLIPINASAQAGPVLMRPIPSSGESLPVIGLGSWITFNVGNDRIARHLPEIYSVEAGVVTA